MTLTKWNEMQLKFDLPELDEAGDDAVERQISPEEARLISEAARVGFESGRGTRDEGRGTADDRRQTSDDRAKQENVASPQQGWVEDYLRLREQGWPWRVACYMAWASSPKVGRWPGTIQELATGVLGLTSPRVIYHWRKKYPSIDTVVSMLQAAPLWEHRRDVLNALVEMAQQPDYKSFNDRKLFLEMTGDYTPKSKLELGQAKGNGLVSKSDAELRMWMSETQEDVDDDA